MATILERVREKLVQNAAVVTLVGQKLYPEVAPQEVTAPYVVITVVDDVPYNSSDGAVADRLRAARVQLDAYAETYVQAHAVADALAEVVGNLGDSDLSAYEDARRDLYDDESQLRRVSMDFMVSA